MNAPAAILPPAVAAYAHEVRRLLPGVEGRELELRSRLMLARDMAKSRLPNAIAEAQPLFRHIHDLAEHYSQEAFPVERLAELRALLIRMTALATDVETFARALNPETRETDARGG